LTFSVYWNACPAGVGGGADLAGGNLLALLLDRGDHVLRHQPAHLQLVRIEPNPHRILAGAETPVTLPTPGSRDSSSRILMVA